MTIQAPDAEARRRAIILVLVAFGICLAILALYETNKASVDAWLATHLETALMNPPLLFAGALILISPLIVATGSIYRFGRAVITNERFPPPGVGVLRPTPILTGSRAIFRGRLICMLALMLFIAGIAVPVLLGYIAAELGAAVR